MDRNHVLKQLVIMTGIMSIQTAMIVLMITDPTHSFIYLNIWASGAILFWFLFWRLTRSK